MASDTADIRKNNISIIILFSLKQSFSTQHRMILKDQTINHSAQTIGNRDHMYEVCISHSIPRVSEQQGWNKRKKQTEES